MRRLLSALLEHLVEPVQTALALDLLGLLGLVLGLGWVLDHLAVGLHEVHRHVLLLALELRQLVPVVVQAVLVAGLLELLLEERLVLLVVGSLRESELPDGTDVAVKALRRWGVHGYLRQVLTQLVHLDGLLEVQDARVLDLPRLDLQVHPGQLARRQVDEHVGHALEVIAAALLLVLVGLHTRVPRCPNESGLLDLRDVFALGVLSNCFATPRTM